MAQIINDAPGIGALLGSGLGQGISTGLQQLAQLKANQLLTRHQQRQTSQGLQALGFSPQEALQVSVLPQELQSLVIKNYLQSAENAGLEQALQGTRVGSEAQGVPVSRGQTQGDMRNPGLAALLGIKEPVSPDRQTQSDTTLPGVMKALRQPDQSTSTIMNGTDTTQPDRASLADILKRPRLSPEHRLKIETLRQQRDIAQQKLSAKEQEEVNKETKPVYDAIQKEAKGAKDNIKRLDRMQELINTGKLDSPGYNSLLKTIGHGIFGMGIDLSHSLTPESQEFEKLSSDFVKNAKDYFGNRLTDADLNAFLRTIPNLGLTNEGKLRVMANLREFAEAALLKKQASDQVLKAAGGRRPRDYEQQVEELVGPQLDTLAERFKNNTPEAKAKQSPESTKTLAEHIADLIAKYR